VAQYLVSVETLGSHRRRAPYAPPRWPNKRDHAIGDAQIHAVYFIANPVYSPMAFCRRYVRKLVFFHLLVFWRILTLVVRACFVCLLMSFFDLSKLLTMSIPTSTSSMMQLEEQGCHLFRSVLLPFAFSHTVSQRTPSMSKFVYVSPQPMKLSIISVRPSSMYLGSNTSGLPLGATLLASLPSTSNVGGSGC
jgi:hypothetical protein